MPRPARLHQSLLGPSRSRPATITWCNCGAKADLRKRCGDSLVHDLQDENICSMDQLALFLGGLPFDAVADALEKAGLAEEVMAAVNAQPEGEDDD